MKCNKCLREATPAAHVLCTDCWEQSLKPVCPILMCKHKKAGSRICQGVTLTAYEHYDKDEGQIIAMQCDGYEMMTPERIKEREKVRV